MKAKMWLSSLQGLAFTRGLSIYKYKTSKIRKHKRKYENGDKYATLDGLNLEFLPAITMVVS